MPPRSSSTIERPLDSFEQYLSEIGQHERLSADQEVELAQLMETGKAAAAYLTEAQANGTSLELLDQQELEHKIKQGQAAKEQFINANLRLVVSIAKRYSRPDNPTDLLDLIQEGNIRLEHAVEKFDWRKGFKFSTYATWWIREGITNALDASKSPFHLSHKMRRDIKYVDAHMRSLATVHPENISAEEIAHDTMFSPEQAKEILAAKHSAFNLICLDQPLDETNTTLHEMLPDDSVEVEVEAIANTFEDLSLKLARLIGQLSINEQQILVEGMGLFGAARKTQKQIGQELGVSDKWVSILKGRAIERLRSTAKVDEFPEIFEEG